MISKSFTAVRILRRFRSGSSTPILVETPGGLFVTKLRGAGQGLSALISEVIVAELAERIGLAVPERALIELPPDTPTDDRNDELADLVQASSGLNLGFRFLNGARDGSAAELAATDDDTATRVLWLDGLTQNPDRTHRNPNILLWNGQRWLIDHGAALPFQHDWSQVTEASPREPMDYTRHVFEDRSSRLLHADTSLAALLDRSELETVLEAVPNGFLAETNPEESPARARAAYRAFLWKRLKAPRPFLPCRGRPD